MLLESYKNIKNIRNNRLDKSMKYNRTKARNLIKKLTNLKKKKYCIYDKTHNPPPGFGFKKYGHPTNKNKLL